MLPACLVLSMSCGKAGGRRRKAIEKVYMTKCKGSLPKRSMVISGREDGQACVKAYPAKGCVKSVNSKRVFHTKDPLWETDSARSRLNKK